MIVDVTGGVIPVPVVWSPSYKHALRLPIAYFARFASLIQD